MPGIPKTLIIIILNTIFYCISCWNNRGLSPERFEFYQSRIKEHKEDNGLTIKVFGCLNNDSNIIHADLINDDFCDCNDGSDEPGTSACAQRQDHNEYTAKYWCKNEGFLSVEIPRWKVNDKICGTILNVIYYHIDDSSSCY